MTEFTDDQRPLPGTQPNFLSPPGVSLPSKTLIHSARTISETAIETLFFQS
jgi:hypothetical protein